MFLPKSKAREVDSAKDAAPRGRGATRAGSALALCALLFSLSVLFGCASGSNGLPSGLQIPSSAGLQFINQPTVVAVTGRSFTYEMIFTGGTAPYVCAIQSQTGAPLTGPMVMAATTPSGGNACEVQGTGGAASGSITVLVSDSSKPTAQQAPGTLTITVNAALAAGAFALANGIGTRAFNENVSDAITGGTGVAPYSCTVGGMPALGLSVTVGPAATTAACTFTLGTATNNATAAPEMDAVTVMAMDSQLVETFPSGTVMGIAAGAAVPAGDLLSVPSGVGTSPATNLVVRPEFVINAPPASYPDGVQGRDYGLPLAPPTVTTTVSGAVGNAPLTACGFTAGTNLMGYTTLTEVASPAGAGANSCALSSLNAGAPTPLSTVAAAPATLTLTITATDTPIDDPVNAGVVVVPANTITATASSTLTVHPPLSYTENYGTTAALPNAVMGRIYGAGGGNNCGANDATACQSVTYTASGGLGGYKFTEAGALPTNVTCPTGSPLVCSSGGAAAGTGDAGPYPEAFAFTVTLMDTANTATPAGSQSTDANGNAGFTLALEGPLAFNEDYNAGAGMPSAALPAAVVNRTYGTGGGNTCGASGTAACQNVVFTSTGGLGGYNVSDAVTAGAFPTNLTCTAGATLVCTSGANLVTGMAASPAVTFTVTAKDTGNYSTPFGTTMTDANGFNAFTLNLDAAISFSENYGITAGLPDAVIGRIYGAGGGNTCGAMDNAACQNVIFTPAGGLGTYTVSAAVTMGAFPTNLTCTAGMTLVCTSGANQVMGTAASPAVTFTVTAKDIGNYSTPAGSQSTDVNNNMSFTLNLDPALSFSENYGTTAGLPDAVINRTYGTGGGMTCGAAGTAACQNVIFTPAGGLGGYNVSDAVTAGAFPTNLTCTAGTTLVCTSGANQVSGMAASPAVTFTVTAKDTANFSTPFGTKSTDVNSNSSFTINLDAVLSYNENYNAPPAVASATLPAAVVGRVYGASGGNNCGAMDNAACLNVIYTPAGGLGGYNVSDAVTAGAFPTNLACTAGATLVCTSGANQVMGAAASPAVTFTVTAKDTANFSTPFGTAMTDANGFNSFMLNLDAALSFSENYGTTAGLPDAVINRTYGTGGGMTCGAAGTAACQNVIFTPAGGLGGFNVSAAVTAGAFPTNLTCTAGATLVCTSGANPVTGMAASPAVTFTVTAKDTANYSTPFGTKAMDVNGNSSFTINLDAVLSFNENYNAAPAVASASLPPAVVNRTYGSGPMTGCSTTAPSTAACQNVIFTATGGLGGYNVSDAVTMGAFPTNLTCATGATLSCGSGGAAVTGMAGSPVVTFTVTAKDMGNFSTPFGSTSTDANTFTSFTLTLDAVLVVTAPAHVPNSLVGFNYPPGITYTEAGGTGGGDTFVFGTVSMGTCTVAGTPPGFTIGAASGSLSNSPAGMVASASDSDYTFNVCVSDTGNFSAPGGSAQTAVATVLNELNTLAAAAGTHKHTVEVINYGTNTYDKAVTLAGSTPSGLAITSDGTTLYVADTANNQITPVDMITLTAGTPSALPVGCGSPVELAATPSATGTVSSRLYATCPGVPEVAVYDISSPANFQAGTIADLATPGTPGSVAIQSDNSHAFVTLEDEDEIYVVDNTQSPPVATDTPTFALDPMTSQPTGIAVTPNGGEIYAYISKNGFGNQPTTALSISLAHEAGNTVTITTTANPNGLVSGETVVIANATVAGYNEPGGVVITVTGANTFTYTDATSGLADDNSGTGTATLQNQQGIEVVDVTNVGNFNTPGNTTLIIDILLTAGATPNPDNVAVDGPANADIYVTFPGTNGFTVLSNTTTPAQIGSFGLPTPGTYPGTDTPGGVTVPPVPMGSFLVYFTAMNMDQVDVITQGTPPTFDATITGLTAGSQPGRIKNIPIPQ